MPDKKCNRCNKEYISDKAQPLFDVLCKECYEAMQQSFNEQNKAHLHPILTIQK